MELLDNEPAVDVTERSGERLADFTVTLLEDEAQECFRADTCRRPSVRRADQARPSWPASQVLQGVSVMTLSKPKLNTSSPKYQTAPPSSCA